MTAIWTFLRKIPAGLKWAAAAFFGGLLLMFRVMHSKAQARKVKAKAEKHRDAIKLERVNLNKAGDDTDKLREELLKNIRDER